jgi:hypothetical protein
MHMYDKSTRKWNATPPDYATILPQKESNLMTYIRMNIQMSEQTVKGTTTSEEGEDIYGTVYTIEQLQSRFQGGS